ncbi:AzlC family ABC transporter permease [Terasakiella sp. A23]|uniref:AzlC family ABC transporter permease n=1 Tax=Terasakiella sp. FCG-A23 TaxID=3080561 RepID=UPI002955B4E6|nr:AzlC family ABC transporter permease [Terasakiella sp. A23]MDV7338190.1 AzlC family ABC transporter permease [Terasakiella sp. A23]
MSMTKTATTRSPFWVGTQEAVPLLGGYIPVAISFGLVSIQSGFSVLETVLISTLIYAGASQFLFVAMVAAGAPLWLVVVMTLLINARHLVYAPNIASYLPPNRWWPCLMHGLTDQIFALAHTRLPQMEENARIGWYTGAALLAWFSWIFGTALGALVGEELTTRWPLLGEVMPFALPALFLVLLAPRFSSRLWTLTLGVTIVVAFALKLLGLPNASIPLAALSGAILYHLMKGIAGKGSKYDG